MHIQAFPPELENRKKKEEKSNLKVAHPILLTRVEKEEEKEKGCTSEKEEEKNNLGVVHPILLTRIGKSEEKKKENFIVA